MIHRKYRNEKMTKDKEDDDLRSLEENKCSLEFTLDWNIKIKEFP